MIRMVDRYIGMAAILGILLVWISLTALMMMFSVLGELRDTTANYGTSDASLVRVANWSADWRIRFSPFLP